MAQIVKRLDHATDALSPRKIGFERFRQAERDRRRSLHGTDTLFNTDTPKGKSRRQMKYAAHAEARRWCAVDACRDNRRLVWPEGHDESM